MVAIASRCLQEDQPAILYSPARQIFFPWDDDDDQCNIFWVGQIFFDFPSDEDDVGDTSYFYGFWSHVPIYFM